MSTSPLDLSAISSRSSELFLSPTDTDSLNGSSRLVTPQQTPTNNRSSQFFTPQSSESSSSALTPDRVSASSVTPRRLFAADRPPEDVSATVALSAMSAEEALETATHSFQNGWNSAHTSINFMSLMNTLRMVRLALEAHPKCDGLWNLKAECQYAFGEYSEAAVSAKTALTFNPRNAAAQALVQQCAAKIPPELPDLNRLNLSETDQSFMDFVETILVHDTLADARAEAATLLELIEPLLEIDPDDAPWLSTKIFCLIIQGNVADFIEVFHRTEPRKVMETVNVIMNALAAIEEKLQTNPRHLPSLVLKTGCLALKGQYEQSMATPNNSSGEDRGVLNKSGEELLERITETQDQYLRSSHEETLAAAETLLQLDPNNLTGIFMKAQALLFQGNKEKALETIRSALLVHPDNELLWVLLAKASFPEHLEEAIEAIEKALRLNARNLVGWGILVQCHCQAGDIELAVATALQADEYFPNHPMLQEILERCLPSGP